MSSSRVARILAGQGIPQTLSSIISSQSPTNPIPPSSPRRPNKEELESKLSHAQVRAEQRKYPAGLGLGLPSNVSARTNRAVTGVGLGISVTQPVTDASPSGSPSLLPTRVPRASRAPELPTIPASPDERIPFSPQLPRTIHGLGLGLTPNPENDSNHPHGLGLGFTPLIPQESFSQPFDTFRRTPGAPAVRNNYFPAIVPSPLRHCVEEYFAQNSSSDYEIIEPSPIAKAPLFAPLRHCRGHDIPDEALLIQPEASNPTPNAPIIDGQLSFFLPADLLTPARSDEESS
ncbi:hypothetical protein CERSUDRAFT_125762 [Gelatoporia subvermispora B]|uniref:Uncharacterized protein n=1 Tax=Ceriporiopsis subvermispora (strain B) TaxID=914234 RepID=M2R6U7_CERS8|nr:hypothetical protein CERSUDRAFT_125762 [Gelatoporia subvermispora B]